jgi:hypothetical protein
MFPDPDWYEAHEEEETYVESGLYGKSARELAQSDVFVISSHARDIPPDATFQALVWDTHTIWEVDGRLITYQAPPIPQQKMA